MIVNHFNTFPYGGAANAALRLHHQMRCQEFDSRFWYAKTERVVPDDASIRQIDFRPRVQPNLFQRQLEKRRNRKICRLFDTHLAARDSQLEVFSMADQLEATRLQTSDFEKQIMHLHWIAFMGDYHSLIASIPRSSPIVWTLHDMNPLTGGCHYSSGCERFRSGCGSCPQVVNPMSNDVSAHGFHSKKRTLSSRQLDIVSPSLWLKRLAEASPMFPRSTRFHHIRLGFDLDQFRPLPTLAARQQLGLPENKVLVGFGAESTGNRRKGLDLLQSALSVLSDQRDLECIVFGSANGAEEANHNLPRCHQIGYVSEPERMAKIYSACDFVVVPSREDNQPQVGLEAMACGTPVIGFDVGGIAEYITAGVTGLLAAPENARDLASQIKKMLAAEALRTEMGQSCRKRMEADFDIVKQSQKYVSLYRELSHYDAARIA